MAKGWTSMARCLFIIYLICVNIFDRPFDVAWARLELFLYQYWAMQSILLWTPIHNIFRMKSGGNRHILMDFNSPARLTLYSVKGYQHGTGEHMPFTNQSAQIDLKRQNHNITAISRLWAFDHIMRTIRNLMTDQVNRTMQGNEAWRRWIVIQ